MNKINETINKGLQVFKQSNLVMKVVYIIALLGFVSFVLRNPFVAVFAGLIAFGVYKFKNKRRNTVIIKGEESNMRNKLKFSVANFKQVFKQSNLLMKVVFILAGIGVISFALDNIVDVVFIGLIAYIAYGVFKKRQVAQGD